MQYCIIKLQGYHAALYYKKKQALVSPSPARRFCKLLSGFCAAVKYDNVMCLASPVARP